MKRKKIVLTGGGTAGHVYPALAVAEELGEYELHYIGGNGIEKDILANFPHIKYHQISGVKLERKLTLKNLLIPFKLFRAKNEAKRVLKEIKPNLIFSKGGFIAVPVALAGKKLHIPIVSHESDLSMGLANKIILHYCDIMCTSFEETAKNKKCVFSGQPIRNQIFDGKKQNFFNNNLPTILVLGGSLGAKFLNDIVFENLGDLTKYFNILHICGKNNFRDTKHINYKLFAYSEKIEDLYASADIVVSRAGSGVINELLALSKPMLLIPLSKKCSRGDQIENAKLFEKKGFAKVIEEEEYNFQIFLKKTNEILKNSQKMQKIMQKNAKNNARKIIFDIISNKIAKK